MNRGHKMRLKRNRAAAESLCCHDRHPLPRVCLREPGSWDVINWRYVIRAQMICYRNNKYSHDAPSVPLRKNVQHRQDDLSRWLTKFRTKTGPQTDDVWRILWRQREHEAVATDFLRQHTNKIYGITAFMLNGLYRNMPVFLEDNFLILVYRCTQSSAP